MMSQIHPNSCISDSVSLGQNVTIGPFCNIQGNIKIGDNTTLKSHVSITGNTDIGRPVRNYSYCVIEGMILAYLPEKILNA